MTSIRRRTPVGLKNNSRDLSIISVISSKFYFEQMEDQNHNTSWFNQVEDKCNHLSLNTNVEKSNISNGSTSGNNSKDKQHASNKALALNNTCSPHVESIDNFQHALQFMNIEIPINYNINALIETNSQNSKIYPILIYSHMEFLKIDFKNIFTSLLHMADYIRSRKVKKDKIENITELQEFEEAVWSFISSICKSG